MISQLHGAGHVMHFAGVGAYRIDSTCCPGKGHGKGNSNIDHLIDRTCLDRMVRTLLVIQRDV